MWLFLFCLSLLSTFFANSALLGDVKLPVEFFKLNVDYENPDKIFKDFEEFIVKFKRDYKTLEEKQFRFNQFVKNYNKIAELNKQAEKAGFNTKYGINHFSDRTDEEFRSGLSKFKPIHTSPSSNITFNTDNNEKSDRVKRQSGLPSSIDLTKIKTNKGSPIVGDIKTQGTCGCCWAFSATAVAETANAIDTGKFTVLSDQEVCDCGIARGSKTPGCTGGDLGYGIMYIGSNGLSSSSKYPYVDGRSKRLGICNMRSTKRTMAANAIRLFELPTRNAENEIKTHLYKYNIPVAAFFKVGEGFKNYEGGIIAYEDCQNSDAQWHSAAIIGYGTDKYNGKSYDFWLVKNSWDVDWGMDGYFKVLRGMNWCKMEESPVSAKLRSSSGSDFDDYYY